MTRRSCCSCTASHCCNESVSTALLSRTPIHYEGAYHARVYQAESCYGSPVRDDVEGIYRLFVGLGDEHLGLLGTVSDMDLFIDGLPIPSAEHPLPLWQNISIDFRQLPERLQILPLRLQSSIAHHPVHVAVASLPKLEHLSHGLLR